MTRTWDIVVCIVILVLFSDVVGFLAGKSYASRNLAPVVAECASREADWGLLADDQDRLLDICVRRLADAAKICEQARRHYAGRR